MKLAILILSLSITSFCLSQTDNVSNGHLSIRGKVIGCFILEDVFFRNLSLGMEFRFLKTHAVGVDFVSFRWRHEHDSTVNDIEYTSGPSIYSRRQYINIDYRWYPFKNLIVEKNKDFYINAFVKLGNRNVWSEDSEITYSAGREELFNHKSTFSDYGMALGLRYGDTRFGFDANIGLVRRVSAIVFEKGINWNNNTLTYIPYEKMNTIDSKWALHMRLNLYFTIFKY